MKPPTWSMPGTCTSSHWPGWNLVHQLSVEYRRKGRGRYVESVLLAESKFERLYAVIDGGDGLDGDWEEAIVAGLGRCSLFMAEACFGSGTRLHHAAQ